MKYPRRREMSGVYISVHRDAEPFVGDMSVDITDLTEEELRDHLRYRTTPELVNLVVTLKNVINTLGEKYKVPFVKTREELWKDQKSLLGKLRSIINDR